MTRVSHGAASGAVVYVEDAVHVNEEALRCVLAAER